MALCRITVVRVANYADLMEQYEKPQENPCGMVPGRVFFSDGRKKPEGMCDSAWAGMRPVVAGLCCGMENYCGEWMKDPRSFMFSCNDGFRPVSFYIERVAEEGGT